MTTSSTVHTPSRVAILCGLVALCAAVAGCTGTPDPGIEMDDAVTGRDDGPQIAAGGSAQLVAYDRYQKCGISAARRLFRGAP